MVRSHALRDPGSEKKPIGLLLFMWPLVGFPLGLSVLFGPVVWITTLGRAAGWRQNIENAVIGLVIIIYVLLSAGIAGWLTRAMSRTTVPHVRTGILVLVLLSAAGGVWLSLTPSLMAQGGGLTPVGARFTIGPYPDRMKLAELKEHGFTGVISLLHPAVVPFEPTLLSEERANAQEIGIELIHLPMLPWISENEQALARIEDLARDRSGTYYVHCYLGRDRVNLVRRVIEQTQATLDSHIEISRSFEAKTQLERGRVYPLSEGVYLTPYPTDGEFVAYFMHGLVDRVVTLLDPGNEGDLVWLEKERQVLGRFGLPLVELPVPLMPFDPQLVLETARKIWLLPRPLAVHTFLSPSTGRSPVAEGMLQAMRSDLPPLPPSLFAEPMSTGMVEVIAPNIAVGPRPGPTEFGSFLGQRGVETFVYVGDLTDPGAKEDHDLLRSHHMTWRRWDGEEPAFLDELAGGGPWYLYGPKLREVREALAERFGPAVPGDVTWDVEAWVASGGVEPGNDTTTFGVTWKSPLEFLRAALPTPKMVVLLGPILLLVTALAAGFAGRLRHDRLVRAPYTRKVFHFIIFTLAAALHVATGLRGVVLFGLIVSATVCYSVIRGDGFPFYEAMARPSDHPKRTFYVIVPLITTALGGLIANFLFAPFAFVGYLVAGWGDAVGEPVGTAWGRHRYRVLSLGGVKATRSLEGSLAVFLVGVVAGFLGLWLYGIGPGTALQVALACGLVGTGVEAISNHGLDNLTIQVAAAAAAFFLLV